MKYTCRQVITSAYRQAGTKGNENTRITLNIRTCLLARQRLRGETSTPACPVGRYLRSQRAASAASAQSALSTGIYE